MCEQLDEIKAILKATAEMSKKNKAELDKYRKETKLEFDKLKKEIAKKEKESEFNNKMFEGEIFWGNYEEGPFEQATKNGLVVEGRKFIQNTTNYKIYDENQREVAKFDILMSNKKYILLIETNYLLPKDEKKTKKNIQEMDAEFDRKIEIVKKYDRPFLKNRIILKAFATQNLAEKYHKLYLDRGYLLLVMENDKPQVITQKPKLKN